MKKYIFTIVFLCVSYLNVYGNDFKQNTDNRNLIEHQILNNKKDVKGSLDFLKTSRRFLTKYISTRLLIMNIKEEDKTYVKVFDQTYPDFFECYNSLHIFYKNELAFYTDEYLKELSLFQLDNILTESIEKQSKSNKIFFNCIDIYNKARTNFKKTSLQDQAIELFQRKK